MTKVFLGSGVSAFFTSAVGGSSHGPYAGLNVGSLVGDDPHDVAANRTALAQALNMPIVFAHQVHGNAVALVDDSLARHTFGSAVESAVKTPVALPGGAHQTDALEAGKIEVDQLEVDGLVTTREAVGLAVYVADCVPVLLADANARVIATAHAGRPGLQSKVISQTVSSMVAQGAQVSALRVAVGPAICAQCYEVPEDMAMSFARDTTTEVSLTRWGTPGIDLQAAAVNELRGLGIEDVEVVAQCTYEHAGADGELFSHRWATHNVAITEGKSGRFAGVLGLLPR